MSAVSRSDGLVLRVGTNEMEPSAALKMAREIVSKNLPGSWVVQPLGRETRDVIVRRPTDSPNPTARQAFDFAYKLQQHRDVEDCEPSLILPSEGPEEMRAERLAMGFTAATSSSSSSSSGGGTHLGCTLSALWAHDLCQVSQAWALPLPTGGQAQGRGILVGHPDTGFTKHPELDAARVLATQGFDFEDGDSDPRDPLTGRSAGHGTSTGSVIMSGENTGTSVTGIAPLANLVPLRVTSIVVLVSYGKLVEAIHYAADRGLHVLSISLGGPLPLRHLQRAVEYATQRGVILVAAAGNVWPFVVYPARLSEVIAVAACNCNRQIWEDSAAGSTVDITAPGESVWRALAETSGFSVERSSGTSYATAITAGAAALWLAHHGRNRLIGRYGISQLANVFKELLVRSGFDRPSGWDATKFGSGILNVRKLLEAPLPTTVAAGGMHAIQAAAAPRATNQLDELLGVFPPDAAANVRTSLMRMLDVPEHDLNMALRDVSEELAYHAVTDMEFRHTLMTGTPMVEGLHAATAAVSPGRKRSSHLPKASRHLQRMVATS